MLQRGIAVHPLRPRGAEAGCVGAVEWGRRLSRVENQGSGSGDQCWRNLLGQANQVAASGATCLTTHAIARSPLPPWPSVVVSRASRCTAPSVPH
jgi:hypothetical protein